jgi:alpha-tubulin suppressor-like RCC1 family protein
MQFNLWIGAELMLLVAASSGCGARVTIDTAETFVEDEPSRTVIGLASGGANTCVLHADRTVTCFGGMFGEPHDVPFSPAVEISMGANFGCVRTENGRIECIDASEYAMPQPMDPPFEIAGIDDATQIAVGAGHACARRQAGRLECWGDNSLGQLGDGTFSSSVVPVPVGLGPVRAVATGDFNTCALTDAGVFCWGRGGYGALGNGSSALPNPADETSVAESSPVHVVGLVDARQVTVGLNHACAIDGPDDSVKCWGSNAGPKFAPYTFTATVIDGLDGMSNVFAGYLTNAAIRSDGHAQSWGNGYLGNGNPDPEDVIVDVAGLDQVKSVAGGWGHLCALVASGDVYCWGDNGFGQLGLGGGEDIVLSPTRVPL